MFRSIKNLFKFYFKMINMYSKKFKHLFEKMLIVYQKTVQHVLKHVTHVYIKCTTRIEKINMYLKKRIKKKIKTKKNRTKPIKKH